MKFQIELNIRKENLEADDCCRGKKIFALIFGSVKMDHNTIQGFHFLSKYMFLPLTDTGIPITTLASGSR